MELNQNKIAIIGLGYVGLPLATSFSKHYLTIGFDKNEKRISELKKGIDSTNEVSQQELEEQNVNFTFNEKDLSNCNIFIIAVPTPVLKSKVPELTPLLNATKLVAKYLKKNDIVIFESTVYPGCTEEKCVPVLEKNSKLIFNKDFFCGYSPERINPGDKDRKIEDITKIVSGSNPKVALKIKEIYDKVITAGTYLADSIKVAEAAKVIENIQRDLNIALVNEFTKIFDILNIDTLKVLEAAGTKWNFLNFKPGLVGGHCIGVDPYYLSYKAQEAGYYSELILSGRRINESMPKFCANKLLKQMIQNKIQINNSNVLVLGYTFKENCPDTRNTKVKNFIEEISNFGVKVHIHDPVADKKSIENEKLNFTNEINKRKYDAIILAVSHDCFNNPDYLNLRSNLNKNGIVFDLKGFFSDKNVDLRM